MGIVSCLASWLELLRREGKQASSCIMHGDDDDDDRTC